MGCPRDTYGYADSPPPLDQRLAAVAAERHAVLSSAEIEEIGLTKRQRLYRARAGRLHELYPSVYAVGHTLLTPRGRWRAAVSRPDGPNANDTLERLRAQLAADLNAPAALAVVDEWCAVQEAAGGSDPAAPGLISRAVDALLGLAL